MGTFSVVGTVPNFRGDQFNLPADNGVDLEAFYKTEKIDTILTYSGGRPVVTVSGLSFVRACRPGLRVRYTIASVDRSNGRGIRGVKLEPL